MNPHRTCQENMDALKKVLTQRTLLALSRRNVEFVLAHQADSKQQLADYVAHTSGILLDPDSLFDVQVKRLHEYKRQLLNVLHILELYLQIKDHPNAPFVPRSFVFAAKASAGYIRAKQIISLIVAVAKLVNSDPQTRDKLKVVFVEDYKVSLAEIIIPAAELSEQISVAGKEASGTGNMKLMLNGAVTLGTMDGANVEIVRQAGQENNYIFGGTVEENNAVRDTYDPEALYDSDERIRRAMDTLVDGTVPTDDDQKELFDAILKGASWHRPDNYFVLRDFESYREARLHALTDWKDRVSFGKKCLYNIAAAGMFSSDRAIRQYAETIWELH